MKELDTGFQPQPVLEGGPAPEQRKGEEDELSLW